MKRKTKEVRGARCGFRVKPGMTTPYALNAKHYPYVFFYLNIPIDILFFDYKSSHLTTIVVILIYFKNNNYGNE